DNLWDEEHGEANHQRLWLDFAEGLGVAAESVRTAVPNDATRALIETYRRAATDAPVAAGVAAIYAYERQVPAVAKAKIEGLRDRYGIVDARTVGFFETHATVDVKHAEGEREIIRALGSAECDAVVDATRAALGAWWDFLTAVDSGQPAQPVDSGRRAQP